MSKTENVILSVIMAAVFGFSLALTASIVYPSVNVKAQLEHTVRIPQLDQHHNVQLKNVMNSWLSEVVIKDEVILDKFNDGAAFVGFHPTTKVILGAVIFHQGHWYPWALEESPGFKDIKDAQALYSRWLRDGVVLKWHRIQ